MKKLKKGYKIFACGQPYQQSTSSPTALIEIKFGFNFRFQQISF
jgi:hypothetical protein